MAGHRRLVRARITIFFLAAAAALPLGLPVSAAAELWRTPEPVLRGSGTSVGSWLVRLRPGVGDTAAAQLLARAGAAEIGRIDDLGVRVVSVPLARSGPAMRVLAGDGSVLSVELDGTVQATVVPRDPGWDKQWGPRKVRAPEAWALTTGARSTVIAVVDTGVDPNQPDLRGRVMDGRDFHNNDNNARDDNGHGTAVAGVAAAAGNNGVGIAGMCWKCRILPVKVLNANGSGSHSNIAAGIVWAADRGADVINLSLATPTDASVIADAVAHARRKGAVVVAAAGNEGSRRKFYPAAYPGVISVAASNSSDRLYRWSNKGSWIKLAAPGCAYTTRRGRSWSWWCGTSFAAPAVAGTVALVESLRPGMSRAELESTVLGTAAGLRAVTRGRLDAARALRNAEASAPDQDPTDSPPPPADPTPSDHDWRGDLGEDDQTDAKTFWLAGDVHVDVDWSGDSGMWIRVVDADGETIAYRSKDESFDFELDASAGWHRVKVGTDVGGEVSYRVRIDQ